MKPRKFSALRAVLTVLILTGFLTGLLLSGALVFYATNGIDRTLDMDMLVAEQGRTTKLYYKNQEGSWEELATERLHGAENRIWVTLDRIPLHVQNAFVAIEDHRFYTHHGVDFRRTAGAVLHFFLPGGDYGGSTITQQLIKNLTGDNAVTVKRKLTEIMRAWELEKSVSKTAILEAYLNTVYLSQGCYGLETAAERYFGKSTEELTLAEGATLAAIIQYPTRYDPIQNPAYSRERRDVILYRMLELGMIGIEEYDDAISTPTELHLSEVKEGTAHHSWFTEVVIEDVISDLMTKYELSRTAASRLLWSGGLSIYTTMDHAMQEAVSTFYADPENFSKNQKGERATSAAVLIDPRNGHLLAVAGGTGEKKTDRGFHLATQMLRSPGSVIKPITVYAPALDRDLITWATVFDDVPVTFTQEEDGYIPWPKNNPRVYAGRTNVCTALEKSTNTVAVRILQKVGLRTAFDFATSLGITTLVEKQTDESGVTFSDVAAAPLALGAVTRGVSVREMTGAYTFLADGGVHHRTISYTAVYDKNGEILLSHEEDDAIRVIGEDSADIMTRMLQSVTEHGTASSLTLTKSVPVAGKTGTSNADTDRWFIGYTPELLCGIWYGYQDARDIGTFAKNPAVTVFDSLVTKIYATHASDCKALDKSAVFPTSDRVVSCLFCRDSGALPGAACRYDLRGGRITLGYFKKGTEPEQRCDTHILVDYDEQTHAVACEHCPPENLRKVALIRVYDRAFPCRIPITDASLVYRHLPFGEALCEEEDRPFFADAYEHDGTYIGDGKAPVANRICAEHLHPEETTEPESSFSEETSSETTAPLAFSTPTETTFPEENEETTTRGSVFRHFFR